MLREAVKRAIKRVLPRPRLFLRQLTYLPLDAIDALRGRSDELIPPRRIRIISGELFQEVGEAFCRHLIERGGLQPWEKILDVGCGVGRVAVPLTRYLDVRGRYEGFDIIPDGIRWCQKAISPRFPNFRFQVVDVFNGVYNPTGKYPASNYRFPFPDREFDLVFLTSVFTHMLPADLENYVREIARVLSPGGRCLITFFLINSESRALIQAGKSTFAFTRDQGGFWTVDGQPPEAAVAYPEDSVRSLLEGNRLRLREGIHYGSWCGRSQYLDYQDIVIAAKA